MEHIWTLDDWKKLMDPWSLAVDWCDDLKKNRTLRSRRFSKKMIGTAKDWVVQRSPQTEADPTVLVQPPSTSDATDAELQVEQSNVSSDSENRTKMFPVSDVSKLPFNDAASVELS